MRINSATSLFAVIGNPVSHSLSPVMHNAAFAHLKYNGVYVAFKVKDISNAVCGIKALGIKGVSITIPHKVSVLALLDQLDESAEKIGAANTIVNRQGELIGFNTDCSGAVKALAEKTAIREKKVIIIGAGGAARAIGFGIISAGGRVTIANRSIDKGAKLALDLNSEFKPLSELKQIDGQILINTTPLGMTPNIDDMPVNKNSLKKEMVVMDTVYNPLKTRLLREAESIGCLTVDGLSMFVYQGALQFELWTGKKAPMDVMKKAVQEKLGNSPTDKK
jgi:shikimate dehydrogenase